MKTKNVKVNVKTLAQSEVLKMNKNFLKMTKEQQKEASKSDLAKIVRQKKEDDLSPIKIRVRQEAIQNELLLRGELEIYRDFSKIKGREFKMVGFMSPSQAINYAITDKFGFNNFLNAVENFNLSHLTNDITFISQCEKKSDVITELRKEANELQSEDARVNYLKTVILSLFPTKKGGVAKNTFTSLLKANEAVTIIEIVKEMRYRLGNSPIQATRNEAKNSLDNFSSAVESYSQTLHEKSKISTATKTLMKIFKTELTDVVKIDVAEVIPENFENSKGMELIADLPTTSKTTTAKAVNAKRKEAKVKATTEPVTTTEPANV
jgi:hypothetical protein